MYEEHDKHSAIISLLEKSIITPRGGLGIIYSQIKKYQRNRGTDIVNIGFGNVKDLSESLRTILKSYDERLTSIAIDLPVYFRSDKPNAKTIMVCAMDPLPPEPEKDKNKPQSYDFGNNVGFWVPFSLIDDWNLPSGISMRSNVSFFSTLLEHYNLYVTDIYKIFFRVRNKKGYQKSNSIKEFTSLDFHQNILQKEIDLIKPEVIITLGNNARNSLLQVIKQERGVAQKPEIWALKPLQKYSWNDQIDILSIPHISGSANGASSKLISKFEKRNIFHPETKKTVIIAKIILNELN